MTQTIITIVIVTAAVGWAVWRLVRTLRSRGGCNCRQCPHSGKPGCHCQHR